MTCAPLLSSIILVAGCVLPTGRTADDPVHRVRGTLREVKREAATLDGYWQIEVVRFGNALGDLVPTAASEDLARVVGERLAAIPGVRGVQVMVGPSATAARTLRVEGSIVDYQSGEGPTPMSLTARVDLSDAAKGTPLARAMARSAAVRANAQPADLRHGIAQGVAAWVRSLRSGSR